MRVLQASFCALLIGLVIGCNSSSDVPVLGEDGEKIAVLVDRMNDESHTTAKMKDMFASGTPIAKRNTKYPGFQYTLKEKPTVNGGDATATVMIEKHAGGAPVEKEWTFVKEGDKWKIKSAPLP